jgi:hypothetical protein
LLSHSHQLHFIKMWLMNSMMDITAPRINTLQLLDGLVKKKGDKPSYCPIGFKVNIV